MDTSASPEIFSLANILSVVALFGALVFGAVMKMLMGRAFKATDDRIKELDKDLSDIKRSITALNNSIASLVKDIVDINHALEVAKNLDGFRLELMEKFLLRVDFVREVSLITNQIEAIHPKIEQLDDRIEDLRNRVSNLEKGAL